MSRCFPYPQPGYEKKPRQISVALPKDLKREKDKKKKKKKKEKTEKKRRSGDEKPPRRHGEGGELEGEKQKKRKSEEREADRSSKRQKASLAVTEGVSVRRNGVNHYEGGDIPPHLFTSSEQEVCRKHENGPPGEGPSVSGNHEEDENDLFKTSTSGRPDEENQHTLPSGSKPGGQSGMGFEPPVLPTDEPPGGQGGVVAREEEDAWWLFRGRDRPSGGFSVRGGSDQADHGGVARIEPRYSAEFDVCILPYIVPF